MQGEKVLVIVAPGQGAQSPGFLSPWLGLPGLRDRLTAWSEVAGIDLVAYGTTAGAEEIRDTSVAQPLLVAAGLAAADALGVHPGDAPTSVGCVAGHSVGELTAAAIAGVLSPEQALTLVRERGKAMAEAASFEQTGMTAILGGDEAEVLRTLDEHGLTPANHNGAGQIVAGGTLSQLDALKAAPPARARLRPLSVAGAFHTVHMTPAVEHLRHIAGAITPRAPGIRLLSNADGAIVESGPEFLDRLVNQVGSPVRWDMCMTTMSALGTSVVIELPPAGTLSGLARRALPGVETLALKSPDDLDRARALLAAYAVPEPEWRLCVAPQAGTVWGLWAGTPIPEGQTIARIAARRDELPVKIPQAAHLIEWLVEEGDPVSAGQPLLRFEAVRK